MGPTETPAGRRQVAPIWVEFDSVCATVTVLLQQSRKRTRLFGELELNLTGMSEAEVRQEAQRWEAIVADGALATVEDNTLIRVLARRGDHRAAARRIAAEWRKAADSFPSWKANNAASRRLRQRARALAAETPTAREAVRLAEAGRWAEALHKALQLRDQQWQGLVKLIRQGQDRRKSKG